MSGEFYDTGSAGPWEPMGDLRGHARHIDVVGVEQQEVEIRVRLGRAGFEKLCSGTLPVTGVWLTAQPDGTYALGVTTSQHPHELGYMARKAERDDRAERFGSARSVDFDAEPVAGEEGD